MGVVHICVYRCGAVELRVIEDVERFTAEFDRLRLRDLQHLAQRHVEIVDSWSVEKPVRRMAQLSERLGRECGRRVVEGGRFLGFVFMSRGAACNSAVSKR